MLANELKEYIILNDKVQFILEHIGCHGFKSYSKEYRCGLPEGKDTTKVRIYKDTLKTKIYGVEIKGDIFSFIMYLEKKTFIETIKKIHEILGLKYSWKREPKKESPLDIFKNVRSKGATHAYNSDDVDIYNEDILMDFLPYLHVSWVEEGIMPYTRDVFNIGYSLKHRRIIIPHRFWSGEENEYLGIMGRTTIEKYELLDIPKYYPIQKFSKGINLYGLQENYQYIQEAGYVVVAESEKSVLKRHSKLDKTVVAICSSHITNEQMKILMSLNVEIILAFDKGITEDHIIEQGKRMAVARTVSYTWDNLELLESKESPMDKHSVIYNYLLKTRKVI